MELLFNVSLLLLIGVMGLALYVIYYEHKSEKKYPTQRLIEDANQLLQQRPFARRLERKR
jgi:hypothetical protein